ncbi:putative tetratricopeptide-like helical domain superfamily [Dioscorea sansibarensis]
MLALNSLPLRPFSAKDTNRSCAFVKARTKLAKITPFPCNPPSLHIQSENLFGCRCAVRNLDGESSSDDSFSVQSLVNTETLSSVLQLCSNLKEVKRVHAVIVRLLDVPVIFIDNNLISSYLRFSQLLYAEKLFDRMPKRNVVSWTAFLSGYLNMGLDDEAMRLFQEMIENSVQPNCSTFACLLKLCGNLLDLELGRQLHACVVKGNWSNLIVDSAIVYLYAQCGDLSCAFRTFKRIPVRDVVCWTTMIMAYVQQGRGNEAYSMFSQMKQHGFKPNEFTVCNVLKGCAEEKELRFGKQLHCAIIKGICRQDVYVGSSLVSMYIRCGELFDARLVFDNMKARNTITWTCMIAGYAQNGFGEEALSLFAVMRRRRVSANNLTIVSILCACGSLRSLCHGKEVHAQILRNHSHRNVFIGSTLIWFYCKCGESDYAARVLDAMPARDVTSWTAIISGLAKLEHGSEALRFLNKMLHEGVEPNPFTYSSALKACAKIEDVKRGRWIHASVNKSRDLSNVFVGSSLIHMYMKCGSIKDAFKVFDTMPERNLVSWKTMVVGYAKNGQCPEALRLMYRMQAEGFHVDDYVRSTVLTACADAECDIQWSSTSCSFSG